MSHAQVVLPLVPVIPTTCSACEGCPKKRSAMTPRCARRSGTATTNCSSSWPARWRTRCSSRAAASWARVSPAAGVSYTTARAPRSEACAANSMPCRPLPRSWPRQARNKEPGVTSRLSRVRSLTATSSGASTMPDSNCRRLRAPPPAVLPAPGIIAAPPYGFPDADARATGPGPHRPAHLAWCRAPRPATAVPDP